MEEITEEAKESGLEIPPILEELDKKTGMPKILTMATVKTSIFAMHSTEHFR